VKATGWDSCESWGGWDQFDWYHPAETQARSRDSPAFKAQAAPRSRRLRLRLPPGSPASEAQARPRVPGV